MMSWAINVAPTDVENFPEALEAARPVGQDAQEVQAQVEAAKAAALALFESGTLVSDEQEESRLEHSRIGCSLSGHVATTSHCVTDQAATITVQMFVAPRYQREHKPVVTGGLSATCETEQPEPEPEPGKEDEPEPALEGEQFYPASVT